MQLQIERQALKKEHDKASKERLENIEKELADLKESHIELQARWQTENKPLPNYAQSRSRSNRPPEIERSNGRPTWKSARLRYGTLPIGKETVQWETPMKDCSPGSI